MTIRKKQGKPAPVSAKQVPALIAWHVSERGTKSYWTRIGAAWDHEDAKGMTLQLELMPVGDGRIVLREPVAETEDTGEGA